MSSTALTGAREQQQATDSRLVYLIAPGGNPNYGDEFILRAWLRYLARARPDGAVVVDCHTPGQAAVLLADCHPRVTFVDTAWRICFETAELPATEAVDTVSDILANPGRMPRIVSGIELLNRADTVHLVGGGYLNVVWTHHLALLAIAAAARRRGARALATGQGLLPVGDADRLDLVRRLCHECTLVDVRDQPSHDLLAGGAHAPSFAGDDAWLGVGDPAVYTPHSPAARDVVFCLQSDLIDDFADGRGLDGLTEFIVELLDRWQLRGEEVTFVEGLPGADRLVYDAVVDRLPEAAFVPFTQMWQDGLPARPGQTWVSTRFHPHLLAAAAGASGIALTGRRDYYTVKHLSLLDAGSRWLVSDGTAAPATRPTGGGFPAARVEALRRRKSALAERLYPPDPPARGRVGQAVRLLTRRR